MRTKMFTVGIAFSVLAAACGSDAPVVTERFGLVDQGENGVLQVLAYDYEPDSSLEYGFVMDVGMNTVMDFPGLGGSGNMSMGMSMGGDIEYAIAQGPQADSVELTMRSSFGNFDLDYFTVDGQSMADQLTPADLADLGGQSALPDMTVVLTESGEILELRSGDAALPTDLLGGFGSGGFSDPTGMSLTGMFGPEMPADEVRVGAEWTVDTSEDIPFFGTLDSSTHYWITGEEEYHGRNVLVIVSATEIADMEMDLMDMMESMMEMDAASLSAMGMDPADMAEMQSELFDGMEMTMQFSYDSLNTTTYFDPAGGVVVWTATDALMTGEMEMSTPEGTGTMTFEMTMDMQMMLGDRGEDA